MSPVGPDIARVGDVLPDAGPWGPRRSAGAPRGDAATASVREDAVAGVVPGVDARTRLHGMPSASSAPSPVVASLRER